MAERAHDLPRLVELHELAVKVTSPFEREHGSLPSGDDDRIERIDRHLGNRPRRLDERGQLGSGDEAHGDQVG